MTAVVALPREATTMQRSILTDLVTCRRRRFAAALASVCIAAFLSVPPASAGGLVDPSTFVPAPPSGAECREAGTSVYCRTRFTFDDGPVPVMDLPCGTVYESVTIPRNIYTEYVGGLLVGRHVTSHVNGYWSLSPNGDGPTVRVDGGWTWRTVLSVPADESTAQITTHGNQLKLGGGLSRYANIAGIFYPGDELYHGQFVVSIFESPDAQDALCAALTT